MSFVGVTYRYGEGLLAGEMTVCREESGSKCVISGMQRQGHSGENE